MLSLRYQLGICVVLLGFTPSFSAIAYDPLDCLNEVSKVDKDITVGLATKLCSGAWTLNQSNATHKFLMSIPPYPVELLSIFVPVPPMQKTPSSVIRKQVKEVMPVF
jgi:hypothetical protein